MRDLSEIQLSPYSVNLPLLVYLPLLVLLLFPSLHVSKVEKKGNMQFSYGVDVIGFSSSQFLGHNHMAFLCLGMDSGKSQSIESKFFLTNHSVLVLVSEWHRSPLMETQYLLFVLMGGFSKIIQAEHVISMKGCVTLHDARHSGYQSGEGIAYKVQRVFWCIGRRIWDPGKSVLWRKLHNEKMMFNHLWPLEYDGQDFNSKTSTPKVEDGFSQMQYLLKFIF
ncbi:unnamed protein product [Microthlaspi erraticum]|uniref:Uncharacterized protein n=1 Tax=Microthlaspi erraticum TaxID=1685480 RepID=A0A6D2L583_9BRAS|nr:unnamed protein product [Microthlaspi erraticum]